MEDFEVLGRSLSGGGGAIVTAGFAESGGECVGEWNCMAEGELVN